MPPTPHEPHAHARWLAGRLSDLAFDQYGIEAGLVGPVLQFRRPGKRALDFTIGGGESLARILRTVLADSDWREGDWRGTSTSGENSLWTDGSRILVIAWNNGKVCARKYDTAGTYLGVAGPFASGPEALRAGISAVAPAAQPAHEPQHAEAKRVAVVLNNLGLPPEWRVEADGDRVRLVQSPGVWARPATQKTPARCLWALTRSHEPEPHHRLIKALWPGENWAWTTWGAVSDKHVVVLRPDSFGSLLNAAGEPITTLTGSGGDPLDQVAWLAGWPRERIPAWDERGILAAHIAAAVHGGEWLEGTPWVLCQGAGPGADAARFAPDGGVANDPSKNMVHSLVLRQVGVEALALGCTVEVEGSGTTTNLRIEAPSGLVDRVGYAPLGVVVGSKILDKDDALAWVQSFAKAPAEAWSKTLRANLAARGVSCRSWIDSAGYGLEIKPKGADADLLQVRSHKPGTYTLSCRGFRALFENVNVLQAALTRWYNADWVVVEPSSGSVLMYEAARLDRWTTFTRDGGLSSWFSLHDATTDNPEVLGTGSAAWFRQQVEARLRGEEPVSVSLVEAPSVSREGTWAPLFPEFTATGTDLDHLAAAHNLVRGDATDAELRERVHAALAHTRTAMADFDRALGTALGHEMSQKLASDEARDHTTTTPGDAGATQETPMDTTDLDFDAMTPAGLAETTARLEAALAAAKAAAAPATPPAPADTGAAAVAKSAFADLAAGAEQRTVGTLNRRAVDLILAKVFGDDIPEAAKSPGVLKALEVAGPLLTRMGIDQFGDSLPGLTPERRAFLDKRLRAATVDAGAHGAEIVFTKGMELVTELIAMYLMGDLGAGAGTRALDVDHLRDVSTSEARTGSAVAK